MDLLYLSLDQGACSRSLHPNLSPTDTQPQLCESEPEWLGLNQNPVAGREAPRAGHELLRRC